MRKTILVVDDSGIMRRFLTHLFCKDYQVVPMEDPFDADFWIKLNDKPDLILLDHHLSGITGLEVLKHFRRNSQLSDIPVIIVSGDNDAELRWKCLEAGANDFMTKPFHPKELKIRVKNMLTQNKQAIQKKQEFLPKISPSILNELN